MKAFKTQTPGSLMLAPTFVCVLNETIPGLRKVVAESAARGIATPAMASALAFFDGYRTAKLPANLLQAQRDYFGAHGYELEDEPGASHHTNWTGTGGEIASGRYNA